MDRWWLRGWRSRRERHRRRPWCVERSRSRRCPRRPERRGSGRPWSLVVGARRARRRAHGRDRQRVGARTGGEGQSVVLCAHLDTVFGADVPHAVRTEGGRSSARASATTPSAWPPCPQPRRCSRPRGGPVWLLATVGEEGLGNLCGASRRSTTSPSPVAAVLAVEGNYLGRVSTVGVGSVRWRVRVSGPGGHAWEAAACPERGPRASPSSSAAIAAIPRREGTSVNVGRIGGGEGINCARARRGSSSTSAPTIRRRSRRWRPRSTTVLTQVDPPLRAQQDVLGDRPAGRVDREHPLVRAARRRSVRWASPSVAPPTSTDANAAHARGIPAVAVGVTRGSGEHTAQEWIETGPIEDGVRALARTVERFEERPDEHSVGRRAPGRVSAGRVPVDGRPDRRLGLLPPVAHRLVAARPQLLRLPDARCA